MRDLGYAESYAYDPRTAEGFSGQNYFPDGMARETFYRPSKRGYERDVGERLAAWAELRKKLTKASDDGGKSS
jgi:putative ATPase